MNEIEYTIKKLNKEKILKELIKFVDLKKIKINDSLLCFTIKKRYEKKVDKFLERKNINVLNKKRVGFISLLKKSVLRIGVIASILLFSILAIILNFFVFDYKILGLERVSQKEILQVLKQEKVLGFVTKSKIKTNLLETKLQQIEGVSFASVILYGNTLVVNIKEKIYNQEYEDKDGFLPIYSNFDGQITEISLIQGTPLVKVGQIVKKGQKLIEPYVLDTSGKQLKIKPMAEIKADTYNTTITNIPDKNITYQNTGKKKNIKVITLGKYVVYGNNQECSFKYFKTEIKEKFLSKNNLIPLKVKYITYHEQKIVEKEDYFNKNKTEILNDCKEKTRQLIESYDIIKEEYYEIFSSLGINTINYTIVVNKSIC